MAAHFQIAKSALGLTTDSNKNVVFSGREGEIVLIYIYILFFPLSKFTILFQIDHTDHTRPPGTLEWHRGGCFAPGFARVCAQSHPTPAIPLSGGGTGVHPLQPFCSW